MKNKFSGLKASSCLLLLSFGLGFFVSCSSHLEKNLDVKGKTFLSTVRYIITKEERKDFLLLSPEKRDEFIEEFWMRRDPDPSTEVNEFKEQYFDRIEEANMRFKGVTPGWLQDRGRVYVLLGPPESIMSYPMGKYSRPYEVWTYGLFPIYFVDRNQSGDYELTPLGAFHLAEITKAQSLEGKPLIPYSEKIRLDFSVQMKRGFENEVLIHIDVPYQNIWFEEKEDKLETTLELTTEIFGSENQKVTEHKKEYKVSMTEEEALKGGSYPIEVPVVLESGKYTICFTLLNKTGEGIQRKKIEVRI